MKVTLLTVYFHEDDMEDCLQSVILNSGDEEKDRKAWQAEAFALANDYMNQDEEETDPMYASFEELIKSDDFIILTEVRDVIVPV